MRSSKESLDGVLMQGIAPFGRDIAFLAAAAAAPSESPSAPAAVGPEASAATPDAVRGPQARLAACQVGSEVIGLYVVMNPCFQSLIPSCSSF